MAFDPFFLLYFGLLLVLFLALKAGLTRVGLSPIIGYIALGWLLRALALGEDSSFLLETLAKIGLVFLLFHIGLEANTSRLVRFLGKAGVVSIFNIALSGALGFVTAYALTHAALPSLFAALALSATSFDVSVQIFGEKRLRRSKGGALFLDIVLLDDIFAVFALALLLSVVNGLERHEVAYEAGLFLLKLGAAVIACFLFSRYVERGFLSKLVQYEKMPDTLLTILGLALIIAALALYLDFSFVIGAFFAGIAFSRDPKLVRVEGSMQLLLDLFAPFFFFWIGHSLQIASVDYTLFVALFVCAVAGKFLGTYLPGLALRIPTRQLLCMALATVPRAEMTMIIAELGFERGLIGGGMYTALALIALFTCLFTPFVSSRRYFNQIKN